MTYRGSVRIAALDLGSGRTSRRIVRAIIEGKDVSNSGSTALATDLEVWGVRRKRGRFEKTFGVPIEIAATA